MKVTTTGLNKSAAFIEGAIKSLNKKIPYVLQESVNDMVQGAQRDHTFKVRSGNAERAIQGLVSVKDWRLTFWINPSHVTNNGYNYAWGLNDGTRRNYKKGAISPKITPSNGNGGVQADDFMGRAWNSNIKPLKRDLTREIVRAFK